MAYGDILTRTANIHHYDVAGTPTDGTLFTGSIKTGKESFDPYVSGFSFIKWINLPTWINNNDFRTFTEKNFKSFQGISNIELETEGIKNGFTTNEFHYTKTIGNKSSEFTLKYQEHSGSPLTRIYDQWVSGIRDPKTGIATYPKETGLAYHSSNHTATLLYVVTRPDADNFTGADFGNIEKVFLWTHVQPKRINLEHYNYESGTHDFFELEQTFSGVLHFGEAVDNWGAQYIRDKVYPFYTENNFDDLSYYTFE